MSKLIKFEFKRIFQSVFFWIVTAFSVVWPILTALVYRVILSLTFDFDNGMSFEDLNLPQSMLTALTWLIAASFITELPKLVALFTCLHIGRDYTDGIIRNKITAGHSRGSIYFSYMITQLCASVFFCVVYICCGLLGLAISGFGVDLNGGEIFGRFAVTIIVFLVMTVLFVVLSLIFRRRAAPIIFCILIALMSNGVSAVIGLYNTSPKAADIYLEGSDQHRGWFQSSMWTSIISGNDSAPFKNVLTHGFIVDENKKKISKSDGKPQTADDYVNKFGTDVVRLWTASEDFRNDIPISEDIMGHIAATYRTIRNTLRFQIGNLFDFDPQKNAIEQSKMTLIDKWVLQKTKHLLKDAEIAYERYDFHRVYQLINRFCSVELSAIYHDILKDRLYTFPSNSYERRSSQTCISIIFKTLISILAPILTFTCDEALAYFTADSDFAGQYVQLLDWPDPDLIQDFEKEEEDFDGLLEFRSKVNEQLEKARQSKFIGQSLDAKVSIKISKNDKTAILLKKYLDILQEVFIVSQAGIFETDDDGICEVTILAADGERCPRSWKWVDRLVDAGEFGKVSEKSYEALKEKYPELVK